MREMAMRDKDELELQIERALESVPDVVIPGNFAARVAARAAEVRRPLPLDDGVRARAPRVGRRFMWIAAALLLCAILVLAPRIGAHGARFWVAFALELEFAALALGLSLRGLRA